MGRILLVFVATLLALCNLSSAKGSGIVNPIPTGGRIVLQERSIVTVRTWLGELDCREGELYLVQPELKLISSTLPLPPARNASVKGPGTLLASYGEGTQLQEIGPYDKGTELVFAIRPGGMCEGNIWYSHDAWHARVQRDGAATSIWWEDYTDHDMNDLHTLVTIQPSKEENTGGSVKTPVVYKLPWMSGLAREVTVLPGEGEHKGAEIDFALRQNDYVTAAAAGTVLWVEDSFGTGSCPLMPENPTEAEKKRILTLQRYWGTRGNVIVIKTDSDVQTVYLHLLRKSALVKPGDTVKQGQKLAKAGNSGFSCGTHLHFTWQHNCYTLQQAQKRRGQSGTKVGEPTYAWSCTKYTAKETFPFTIRGISQQLTKKAYVSDNQVP